MAHWRSRIVYSKWKPNLFRKRGLIHYNVILACNVPTCRLSDTARLSGEGPRGLKLPFGVRLGNAEPWVLFWYPWTFHLCMHPDTWLPWRSGGTRRWGKLPADLGPLGFGKGGPSQMLFLKLRALATALRVGPEFSLSSPSVRPLVVTWSKA